MLHIHVVLHPSDFSKHSENALHMACAVARDYGARLVVLHAAPLPYSYYTEGIYPPDTGDLLEEARQQLELMEIPFAPARTERRFEEGNPVTAILRAAQEIHADLIVMGTHGRTGLERLLMGSVAEQIVRKASCPVLTVTGRLLAGSPLTAPAAAHAAPADNAAAKDPVQVASEDSFPASDPPAWIGH